MSDPLEYFFSFSKFREIWRDNKDARIIVECHAGQAWISLHHRIPCPPPQPPRRQSQPCPPRRPRRPGPSRLRRRARREEARRAIAAAENAATFKQDTIEGENITANDTAVQVEQLPVDVNLDVAAEQAGQPSPATEQVPHHQVKLNVDARPWPHGDGHVQDLFCPDHQYLQQQQPHLPQEP